MIYQDDLLYYVWKPAGIPSTWGKQTSILDLLERGAYRMLWQEDMMHQYCDSMHHQLHKHIASSFLQAVDDFHSVVQSLLQHFSREQEYGLVNRLDTPTAGFLYFAKDVPRYIDYKLHHASRTLYKQYLAKVVWKVAYILDHGAIHPDVVVQDAQQIHIHHPLMHHVHLDDRMVVIKHPKDVNAWRGRLQEKITTVRPLYYEKETNQSLVQLTIQAGARHQIRAHLWALWYPILGERLYTKQKEHMHLPLHLWSIGVSFAEDDGWEK